MFAFLNHPAINPVILNIAGPFAIRWYSLMYVVGFVSVYFFIQQNIKKKNILMTMEDLSDILFVAIIGVLLGARLGYVLFYNLGYYLQNPLKIFVVWEGGMSFHGGLIFTILLTFLYVRKKKPKMNFFDVADAFVIPAPLALGFGRWGNFVNGELWGRPTASRWGMLFRAKFPSNPVPDKFRLDEVIPKLGMTAQEVADKTGLDIAPGATEINLPRFPSQLYEMMLEGFLLFAVMFILYKVLKNKPRGLFLSIFMLGYGVARFLVEFVREPDAQLGYLLNSNWFTMGMVLSIPMILLGIAGIIYVNKKQPRNELWGQ